MKIMGLDPGTINMGWGVVRYEDGQFREWSGGVIHAPQGWRLSQRLRTIFNELDKVMGEHAPTVVAIETPFVGRNPKTAIAIGQAQAIGMILAEMAHARVEMYTPAEVKAAASSYGGSRKSQVSEMVGLLLGIEEKLPLDQTDALAVAICFANRMDEAAIMERMEIQ
jgi:crossover junction endodeoxyribonuclease RuvC